MWEHLRRHPGTPYEELLAVGARLVPPGQAWRLAEYYRRHSTNRYLRHLPPAGERVKPFDHGTVVRSGQRKAAYRTVKDWRLGGRVRIVDGKVYPREKEKK